jgi:hypothetical protein
MEFFIFWLGMALLTGWLAGRKGRSGFGWFLFGFVFWPAALIAILVIESRNPPPPLVMPQAMPLPAEPVAAWQAAASSGAGDPIVWLATATAPHVMSDRLAALHLMDRETRQPLAVRARHLDAGAPLDLRAEPAHRLGPETVAASSAGALVGYLDAAAPLATLALARGLRAEAVVDHVEPGPRGEPIVTLIVTIYPRHAGGITPAS